MFRPLYKYYGIRISFKLFLWYSFVENESAVNCIRGLSPPGGAIVTHVPIFNAVALTWKLTASFLK